MKYASNRPYSDPEKAARRLMEHAQAFEPIQDVLFGDKGTPTEYGAGMKMAIERGWLVMHESGTSCH
jgi:hypothetical protein